MSIIRKILTLVAGAAILTGSLSYAATNPLPAKGNQRAKQDFTVVIDAGHGGHDIGATDNGIREKDVNLGVAKELAELLGKKRNDVKVVMTRDKDEFISLQERANVANRNRGDLFISIHTNSLDKNNRNRKNVQGASVYALGLHKDADNLRVAQRENAVIELENNYEQKYAGFDPKKDESYIIFEMAQKRNLGNSLKFAGEAQKQLVNVAGRADRGVKQAGFWVLWATSMPAVLVELDFICNPSSAKFIGSKEGQKKMAQALFNAIESYESTVSHSEKVGSSGKNVKKDDRKSNKDKKKKDRKKKRRSKGDETAEVVDSAPIVEETSDDDDVPVLVSATHATKSSASVRKESEDNSRSYNFADTGKRNLPVGQRKRRSASSRKASANRDMNGKEIMLNSETAFLARVEEKKVEEKTPVIAQEEPVQTDSKKKKNKKKSAKDKKSNQKDKKNSGIKKIYVSSGVNVAAGSKGSNVNDDKNSVNGKQSDQVRKGTADKSRKHTSLAGKHRSQRRN